MRVRVLVTLLLSVCAGTAQADAFRPAYLEVREIGADRYDLLWKVPVQADMRPGVQVRFPTGTTELTPRRGMFAGPVYIERWQVSRPGGFAGQTVGVDGIASGITDVLVRVERADGTSQVERLPSYRPEFKVQAASGPLEVARSYLVLGVQHILGGVDHLAFVLALLLIVRGGKRIALTITAFTVAHSMTLAAATLGWLRVPGPPVEAMIALSIVFVAAEVVHGLRGKPGLTARAPWVVAFSFGLLHGFGFAGALAEVGLPPAAIPMALLMFNVGVELGQLIFVVCMLGVGAMLQRIPVRQTQWARVLPAYVIGAVAMFWVVERIGAFWG